MQNIKRDPFEQAVGIDQKTAAGMQGALGAPATAYQYDWNMLPIGQQLWLKWFETLKAFPPMQAPASYNLTQVMDPMKADRASERLARRAKRDVTERASSQKGARLDLECR